MTFLILFIVSFLVTMFVVNLKSYLTSPKYNKWVHGRVDGIEIKDDVEIWTIKWNIPASLRDNNPAGPQHYYVTFKHHKKWDNPQAQKAYVTDKVVKNVSTKYFLGLKVDKTGVIREVGKYDGYLPKAIFYGILIVAFAGLLIWYR